MNKDQLKSIGHPGIEKLVRKGIEIVQPSRVFLFGSRASGTHRIVSDFDIAFEFLGAKTLLWNQFLFEIDDEAETLFPVDWVNMNEASCLLRETILKEGRCLYEKKGSPGEGD